MKFITVFTNEKVPREVFLKILLDSVSTFSLWRLWVCCCEEIVEKKSRLKILCCYMHRSSLFFPFLYFQLSEDIGYVLYSALGSFYIPSCIMVFVYIRIYYAAKARARRGIRKQPRKPPNEQVSLEASSEGSKGFLSMWTRTYYILHLHTFSHLFERKS